MSERPHICHLSSEQGWRGGEHQVFLLARSLMGRGYQQSAVVVTDSPLHQRLHELDIPCLPFPRRWYQRSRRRALAQHLHHHVPAICHAHNSRALDLAGICRLVGAPVVHSRRVAFPVRHCSKYQTAADCYIAVSHAVARELHHAGCDNERILVIPDALDAKQLEPATIPRQWPCQDSQRTVCCVGMFVPEKGHGSLLAAWEQVVATEPDAHLILVGDGPWRARIERYIQVKQLTSSVHIVGFQTDVAPWIGACDIYVQPSRMEGLGSSAALAAALGKALVVTDVGGLPEIVQDHSSGRVVPNGDIASLTAALVELLQHPELRQRWGASAARGARRRFMLDKVVDAHEACYEAVLRQRR